jgi:hypothetical protein
MDDSCRGGSNVRYTHNARNPFRQYRRVLEGVNQVPATSIDGFINGVSQNAGMSTGAPERSAVDPTAR